MSQPVIIKNKIVYGYMDKATVCRDMGREDYNDLTEAQQLNGDVCFIQGVDASALAPTNNIWNKLGTTPLAAGLPADCSQAINQIKSNLTQLVKTETIGSITTTALGLYVTNLDFDDVVVIGGKGTYGDGFYCTPTRPSAGGKVILKCTDDNNATIKSKTVTGVEVYYIEKNS